MGVAVGNSNQRANLDKLEAIGPNKVENFAMEISHPNNVTRFRSGVRNDRSDLLDESGTENQGRIGICSLGDHGCEGRTGTTLPSFGIADVACDRGRQ